jgi:hypothetical protein
MFLPDIASDHDLPTYAFWVTEILGAYYHAGLVLLRWSLDNFLPGLALNCSSPDFGFLSSWDYRCEP